ncbi:DUF881 domain-containing protein [Paraoerskovia marina]|uniref:DUF881 domain-containing protein n=1 Tax=Paraoerskovia marina TaxID=545619 RepID=UPI000693293C|nr:DUF881 domain-containing protein [Paraoerskovia marina]
MTRRPDESMTLLREVMERPLDPGYAAAAERRAQSPDGGTRRAAWVTVTVFLVAAAIGLVVTVAAVTLRAPQPAAAEARTLLETELADRERQADALGAEVDGLSDEVEALRSQTFDDQDPDVQAALLRDGVVSGSVAVEGGGLLLTLADASALAGAEIDTDSRVHDDDLQRVVNSLWYAGAEAISINGRRLTPLSAIRSAGQAILVDLQPVSSPYRITAVGDPTTMQTEFAKSPGASFILTLSSFGIQSSTTPQSSGLSVPADPSIQTFYAQPLDSNQDDADDTDADSTSTEPPTSDPESTP